MQALRAFPYDLLLPKQILTLDKRIVLTGEKIGLDLPRIGDVIVDTYKERGWIHRQRLAQMIKSQDCPTQSDECRLIVKRRLLWRADRWL